ncbi:MAG: aspartate aminotransferase family protein, partial [Pseudomonadota bacterium]
IDLAPGDMKPGERGYAAIERMYHEHDLYCRVTMDTLIVAPPLIASKSELEEIRDKISKVLHAVA